MVVPPRCGVRVGYCQTYDPFFRKEKRVFFWLVPSLRTVNINTMSFSSNKRLRFLWRAHRARIRDERAELAFLHAHVQPSDLVCDIGANKGAFTYWLAKWASKGKVFAFEPQPRLADYLKQARQAFDWQQVAIEAKAVGDKDGPIKLFMPNGDSSPDASIIENPSPSAQGQSIDVDCVALDTFFPLKQRIAALKIDVEGAELDVFKGAERILREHRPALLFECEQRHLREHNVNHVFRYLERMGYRGQFIRRGRRYPINLFDVATHQPTTGERFWDKPDYVNNFAFCIDS